MSGFMSDSHHYKIIVTLKIYTPIQLQSSDIGAVPTAIQDSNWPLSAGNLGGRNGLESYLRMPFFFTCTGKALGIQCQLKLISDQGKKSPITN